MDESQPIKIISDSHQGKQGREPEGIAHCGVKVLGLKVLHASETRKHLLCLLQSVADYLHSNGSVSLTLSVPWASTK